jgi:hypothetical protein
MFKAVEVAARRTLKQATVNLAVLGDALADAAKCALNGVQNMMLGVFNDLDAMEMDAEGVT